MIGAEREYKITIGHETCSVGIYQRTKTVWVARGSYRGEHIETKDRSERQCVQQLEKGSRIQIESLMQTVCKNVDSLLSDCFC